MNRCRHLAWAAAACVALGAQGALAADQDFRKLDLPDEGHFEESWFTADKLHMYLGLGSMAAAVVAATTAPDAPEGVAVPPSQRKNARNTTHHIAAVTAAALGGAAILSGLITHWDDITNSYGITDPDLLHMMLGIVATAAYVWTISKGPQKVGDPSNGHSGIGIVGGAAMLTAIALEW